jgi:chemotaxis protein methyltransferase CheR
MHPALTDAEFVRFQRFIHSAAGITLSDAKKALVAGRLSKRLAHHGLHSFGSYLALLSGADAGAELQTAVDLLTTNETYFFREPRHFDLLRELAQAARARRQGLRVWSAACSSGEEVYSIAMVLDDVLGETGWELLGSDISTRVLQRARSGHYVEERARHIPPGYLKRYCLRGTGEQQGNLLVERRLRQRVRFEQINLNEPLPRLGSFDVIFLRNVMIYFNAETKRQVVARLLAQLASGGTFCIGHSETLNDISDAVVQVVPSIYQKP